MKLPDECAVCLLNRQTRRVPDEAYLARVKQLIDTRDPEDCAPMLIYRFNQAYLECFGERQSYAEDKRRYNDLALGLEAPLRSRVEAAEDPVAAALALSRVGNYIDFGALDRVDEHTLFDLFHEFTLNARDEETYRSFLNACASGRRFLLITDNCGEIVLDKLLIEQLKKRFPHLEFQALVRGGEVLNDATAEDAAYVGLDRVARIIPNGLPVAGTVYALLSDEARSALDDADIILSKGQANYESLSGEGRHVFFAFLCKCALFTRRFNVPLLTGMLVEETA